MGSAPSKSSGDGVAFQNSAVPIQFSNPLVSKLEDPKTASGHDSSSIESLIQQRVADELKRLKAAERESFTQTTLDVSADASSSSSGGDKDDLNAIILQREIDALKAQVKKRSSSNSSTSTSNLSPDQTKSDDPQKSTSSSSSSSALSPTAAISSFLSSTTTSTTTTTGGAEKARDAVITCLRKNAGRSLDCRVEVLDFKKAVAELQKGFIEQYQ